MQFPKPPIPATPVEPTGEITRANAIVIFRESTGLPLNYCKDNFDLNFGAEKGISIFSLGRWIKAYYDQVEK